MKNFNEFHIYKLYEEGVRMYLYKKLPEDACGWYYPDTKRIHINSKLEQELMNLTIIHEWLHAYEDLILDIDNDDNWVDACAYFHINQHPHYLEYIKDLFPRFKKIK